MKRTQILVWAILVAIAGCKSSDDGGSSNAGAGGSVAGTGGSIAAGTGGSIAAGTGGNSGTGGTVAAGTGGTGGSAAGTGGSTAGTGGSAAGTGGSAAGTGGGPSQACIDGAATASGVDPVTEMECISCLCTANEAAVAGCNAECWDLVLCVRDNGCYSCAGELDQGCAFAACGTEATTGNANADATAFLPTVDMCLPQCIEGC